MEAAGCALRSGLAKLPQKSGTGLRHDRPGAVGLPAGATARRFRPSIDVNPLRVIRAAETVGVFVVVADLELAVIAVVRIPPFVLGVRSSGVETVHVSLVRISAILAIQVARQRCPHGASDHNASDRRARASATMTEDVAQETPNHRAADDARGVHALVTVSIVG